MTEAPRGALAHWIVIKDSKIENYQLVVPTHLERIAARRQGQMSSYEAALIGTPVDESRAAAGTPAHDPLVRSLSGLRRASLRPEAAATSTRSTRFNDRLGEPRCNTESITSATRLRLGAAGPVLSLDQRRCASSCWQRPAT